MLKIQKKKEEPMQKKKLKKRLPVKTATIRNESGASSATKKIRYRLIHIFSWRILFKDRK